MKITRKWLEDRNACEDQIAVFAVEWPNGATVNKRRLIRAGELGLDLNWLAERILTAPAWAEYQRVEAPAWAEYERVTASALWRCYRDQQAGRVDR